MEENSDVSMKGVALKYGTIAAIIGIVVFVVSDMADLVGNQVIGFIPILALAVLMLFAHKEFIKYGDGYMNYGQGLGLGTLLSLVYSIISGVFTVLYTSFINENYSANLLETQRVQFEEQGMSDAQIDQAMGFTESMMSPWGIAISSVVTIVFLGFIVALIISAITKKTRPEFE